MVVMTMLKSAHERVALPSVIHQIVTWPATTRVIVVGDVHGCLDELLDLLRAADFDQRVDRLILVGDLVNKGPKSAEVVRFVRENDVQCVRGNHDDAALSAYYDWKASGDESPPDKYDYVRSFSSEDVTFLEQLPFSITLINHATIVVHAGLVPGVPLEAQQPINMYKMRVLARTVGTERAVSAPWVAMEKRPVVNDQDAPDVPVETFAWATQWVGPQHVIFGHDAKAGLQQEAFATGLDTGCCYGRKLTACILPTRELVAVDAKKVHVPPVSTPN